MEIKLVQVKLQNMMIYAITFKIRFEIDLKIPTFRSHSTVE